MKGVADMIKNLLKKMVGVLFFIIVFVISVPFVFMWSCVQGMWEGFHVKKPKDHSRDIWDWVAGWW